MSEIKSHKPLREVEEEVKNVIEPYVVAKAIEPYIRKLQQYKEREEIAIFISKLNSDLIHRARAISGLYYLFVGLPLDTFLDFAKCLIPRMIPEDRICNAYQMAEEQMKEELENIEKDVEAFLISFDNFVQSTVQLITEQSIERLKPFEKDLERIRTQEIIYPHYDKNKWHDPFKEYSKESCEVLVYAAEEMIQKVEGEFNPTVV
jgi:hypothetical protein